MFDTLKVYKSLRAANMGDAQARALVEVMKITHSSPDALDTNAMRDILRDAGFDEKKTRALLDVQLAAHKELHARAAHA